MDLSWVERELEDELQTISYDISQFGPVPTTTATAANYGVDENSFGDQQTSPVTIETVEDSPLPQKQTGETVSELEKVKELDSFEAQLLETDVSVPQQNGLVLTDANNIMLNESMFSIHPSVDMRSQLEQKPLETIVGNQLKPSPTDERLNKEFEELFNGDSIQLPSFIDSSRMIPEYQAPPAPHQELYASNTENPDEKFANDNCRFTDKFIDSVIADSNSKLNYLTPKVSAATAPTAAVNLERTAKRTIPVPEDVITTENYATFIESTRQKGCQDDDDECEFDRSFRRTLSSQDNLSPGHKSLYIDASVLDQIPVERYGEPEKLSKPPENNDSNRRSQFNAQKTRDIINNQKNRLLNPKNMKHDSIGQSPLREVIDRSRDTSSTGLYQPKVDSRDTVSTSQYQPRFTGFEAEKEPVKNRQRSSAYDNERNSFREYNDNPEESAYETRKISDYNQSPDLDLMNSVNDSNKHYSGRNFGNGEYSSELEEMNNQIQQLKLEKERAEKKLFEHADSFETEREIRNSKSIGQSRKSNNVANDYSYANVSPTRKSYQMQNMADTDALEKLKSRIAVLERRIEYANFVSKMAEEERDRALERVKSLEDELENERQRYHGIKATELQQYYDTDSQQQQYPLNDAHHSIPAHSSVFNTRNSQQQYFDNPPNDYHEPLPNFTNNRPPAFYQQRDSEDMYRQSYPSDTYQNPPRTSQRTRPLFQQKSNTTTRSGNDYGPSNNNQGSQESLESIGNYMPPRQDRNRPFNHREHYQKPYDRKSYQHGGERRMSDEERRSSLKNEIKNKLLAQSLQSLISDETINDGRGRRKLKKNSAASKPAKFQPKKLKKFESASDIAAPDYQSVLFQTEPTNFPFLTGKATPSFSLPANIQKVLAMLKCNPAINRSKSREKTKRSQSRSDDIVSTSSWDMFSVNEVQKALKVLEDEYDVINKRYDGILHRYKKAPHGLSHQPERERLANELKYLIKEMELRMNDISKLRNVITRQRQKNDMHMMDNIDTRSPSRAFNNLCTLKGAQKLQQQLNRQTDKIFAKSYGGTC